MKKRIITLLLASGLFAIASCANPLSSSSSANYHSRPQKTEAETSSTISSEASSSSSKEERPASSSSKNETPSSSSSKPVSQSSSSKPSSSSSSVYVPPTPSDDSKWNINLSLSASVFCFATSAFAASNQAFISVIS